MFVIILIRLANHESKLSSFYKSPSEATRVNFVIKYEVLYISFNGMLILAGYLMPKPSF